jgi:hypothetical protein
LLSGRPGLACLLAPGLLAGQPGVLLVTGC